MTLTQLEVSIANLYATAPVALPFAPELDIRAFLLERKSGNLLIYSSPEFDVNAPEVQKLGGVARHYLNHAHEAMFVSDKLNAPLFCNEKDRTEVARETPVAGTFSSRQLLDDDFEVIPIPGHTPGTTAYLWDSGEHRFLFTGDTVALSGSEWVAAVLGSSDRAAYLESLELIRELEFDVLVPWAATHEQPYYAETDSADTKRRIDAILKRVRHGENS